MKIKLATQEQLENVKSATDSKLQHIEMSIDKAVYADEGKLYRGRLEFREGSPWAVRDEVGVQIKNGGYTYTPLIKGKVKLSFKVQGDSAERENILIWADDGTGEDKYIAKVSDRTGLYSCVLDVVNDVKISTLGASGVTFKFWDFRVQEV